MNKQFVLIAFYQPALHLGVQRASRRWINQTFAPRGQVCTCMSSLFTVCASAGISASRFADMKRGDKIDLEEDEKVSSFSSEDAVQTSTESSH